MAKDGQERYSGVESIDVIKWYGLLSKCLHLGRHSSLQCGHSPGRVCSRWFLNVLALSGLHASACVVLPACADHARNLGVLCLSPQLENELLEGRCWISSLGIPASGTKPQAPRMLVERINTLKKDAGWRGKEVKGERMKISGAPSDLIIITPLSDVTC